MTDIPDAAVDLVSEYEESGGFAPRPYLDPAGIPTIGIGSIWDRRNDPPTRVTMDTPPVDEATARAWARAELAEAAAAVARNVRVPLTEGQTAALEDLIYNIGSGAFASSTLLRKLNRQDYAGAAAEFARWDHAGGRVLAGLLRRRIAERDLFVGGTPDASA